MSCHWILETSRFTIYLLKNAFISIVVNVRAATYLHLHKSFTEQILSSVGDLPCDLFVQKTSLGQKMYCHLLVGHSLTWNWRHLGLTIHSNKQYILKVKHNFTKNGSKTSHGVTFDCHWFSGWWLLWIE